MRMVANLVALLLLVSPFSRAANPGDVVINEVCWLGSTSVNLGAYDEWIELFNNTASAVDLTGWSIDDDGGSAVYQLSGTIEAGAYFLIERREEATDLAADLVVADMNLGNAGDSLELLDDQQTRIDFVDTAGGWWGGGDLGDVQYFSMERRDPLGPGQFAYNWGSNDGLTINGNDSGSNPLFATPKAPNSIQGTVPPGPGIAHIHCVDAESVDVTFSEPVEQTSAETPTNYLIDDYLSPSAAQLDDTDASLVHLVGFAGLTSGELVELTAAGVLGQTGGPSNSTAAFVTGVVPVAYARTDLDGTFVPDLIEADPQAFVTVEGVVSSARDFDSRDARLQDESGGLAIWDTDEAVTPVLARGDRIRISGNLDQYNGLDQIISPRAEILDQGNQVTKTPLTLAEFLAAPEVYENMLVSVSAVSDTGAGDTWPAEDQNANLEISDDGGTSVITLRIDLDTDIDGSPEPDYPVDLAGIAGQYDTSDPRDQGYQVLPRDLADIGTQCEDEDQDGYGTDCALGPDCDDSDAQVNPGAQESCDGIDNDCDSDADEDWPELGQACDGPDEDICESGQYVCNPSQDGVVCDDPGAQLELCNQVDDDCDGETDEDWPELGEPCDGPDDDTCENGIWICNGDQDGAECDEPTWQLEEECNGIDDDCDGETDENLGTYTCGAGPCAVTVDKCKDGLLQQCIPLERPMQTETGSDACRDGIDNDCNGLVDDKDANCRSGTGDGCGCATSSSFASALLGLLGIVLLLAGIRIRRSR